MAGNASITKKTRRRYDRLARFFDLLEAPMEKIRFGAWRSRFREQVSGPEVLEVGTGTGKNMPHYPRNAQVTAIDFSPKMLTRAKQRAKRLGIPIRLEEMDVQQLAFPDDTFDTAFAAFVFCSVPDPVQGLKELRRVVKPGGKLVLLEHMRPEGRWRGLLFDILNPIVVRIMGANINRRTMDKIRLAGWKVEVEDYLSSDVVRWIEAHRV